MNPFGQELKKILIQSKTSGLVSYVGRSAYIQLDPELRVKLDFLSLNISNQYNALKLTVLNRTEGAVDMNIIRFGDLLGKKKVSNPNFSDGVLPHLWDDYGKVGWYVYQPTQAGLQCARRCCGRVSAGVPAGGNTARSANLLTAEQ